MPVEAETDSTPKTILSEPRRGSIPSESKTKIIVPFHRPCLGPEEEAEVIDTLRSGWLTTGPKTKRFEKEFAAYTGAKHAIAVNSCTAALHTSLVALGIGPGDEVITTPITFASTANVIEHVGAKPVFVDVEPDTLNLNPALLEQAITTKTKAIIPVHFAGHPCDMDAIQTIATAHGLHVIEDAAHAIESVYQGKKIGSISRTTCFSFYATKNMTTGEGGMITTQDNELAERLRVLSLHGISTDAWKRYGPQGYKHWDILEPGFKYNMFDIQAAIGLHQLRKIDNFHALRQRWVHRYDEAFADLAELIRLRRRTNITCAFHLYAVRFDTESLSLSRDQIIQKLQERGIGIGVHFRAVHLHPFYRIKYGYCPGTFPVAEYAGDRLISLPLFPTLTEEQIDFVIRGVRDVVIQSRR